MKIPGLRWVIACLLFAETLLAYLDLQEMSVLAPVLAKTIGMTNAQYAFVAQGFLVSYTVAFLLGGMVIDKLGVRWGLGASIFCWSVANALHALANWGSTMLLGAVRIALPGLTALLVINLAFGVTSRAAPSLNLFAVGLPVTLVFGLVVIWLGLPSMQTGFLDLLNSAFQFLRALGGVA